MPTPLFIHRLSNKFEKSLEGLNIPHLLRIIVAPSKKDGRAWNPEVVSGVKSAVTFTAPYL
jgi:hypothetical protein